MIKPEKHNREEQRIKTLESYEILDSLPEADYENLTLIASQICNTPIAQIVFIDKERQWVKSSFGIDSAVTPRDITFCGHTINDFNDFMIVPDARDDVRFQDHPLVIGHPNIIFYAGVPLKDAEGLPLGTICVFDHKPKTLSATQITTLKALSQQTMRLLELRLSKKQLERTVEVVESKNLELERFAYIAAHDLKSPLANISGLTELLQSSYGDILDQDGTEILDMIRSSSSKLKEMIDNLLEYSKTNTIKKEKNSTINVEVLKNEILAVFAFQKNCTILFKSSLTTIVTNRSALEQILINLISNAIKYNDKESITIEIVIVENKEQYTITVSDNGPGILKENQEIIFDIFEVASTVDRFGLKGTGIGLATVKKIVETLGGKISVESALGNGAAFTFTLERS